MPKGRRFKQILMLNDLPDFHADRGGDFFEIRLLVCGHRNGAFWTGASSESGEDRGRHYINEVLGANRTAPSHGENRGSSPLGRRQFNQQVSVFAELYGNYTERILPNFGVLVCVRRSRFSRRISRHTRSLSKRIG
jgi:hypothetical protein